MFSCGLFDLLQSCEPLTSLIGDAVYPIMLPEGTKTGLTYQIVGGSSSPTFDTAGLQKQRIQFDAFAPNVKAAYQVRDVLRQFLNQFQGPMSDGTFLELVDLIQMIDFFNNDARSFRCSIEFYFYFNFTS